MQIQKRGAHAYEDFSKLVFTVRQDCSTYVYTARHVCRKIYPQKLARFFYTRAVKHILCDLGEKTSERCRELKVGDLHLERIVNVKGEHWTRVLQNGRCVFMSYIDGTDQWCSVERYDIGSSASWGKRILRLYDDLPDIKRKLDDRDPSVMLYYDKHQMERPSAAATADSPTVHLRHARPGNSLS